MRTDKELLALAAKAAGADVCWYSNEFYEDWMIDRPGENEFGPTVDTFPWHPLTDDGDALRLAVKLRLPIRDGFNGTVETGNAKSGYPIWELYGDDPYAATRRVIVRAAAEIGALCTPQPADQQPDQP